MTHELEMVAGAGKCPQPPHSATASQHQRPPPPSPAPAPAPHPTAWQVETSWRGGCCCSGHCRVATQSLVLTALAVIIITTADVRSRVLLCCYTFLGHLVTAASPASVNIPELETKAIRRFAKISQSRRRLLGPIAECLIASRTL